jgi:hypothetical protein
MMKRLGWALLSISGILPAAALCADRIGGEEVLPMAPHQPDVVELNRLIWTPGDPVASLYGNPMGRSVRVVFPAPERLILPTEEPGLRLLSMAAGPGRRPLQARTLWFMTWASSGLLAMAGTLVLALAVLAGLRRRRPAVLALLLSAAAASALPLAAADDAGAGRLTVEYPVAVTLVPPAGPVAPGAASRLALRIEIPEGLWIGAADRGVRSPGPTVLAAEPSDCLAFEPPEWPEPAVEGIPVKLGTTRVYKGRVTVAVPFRVDPACPAGEHVAALRLTYTPGLNAGHLSPHLGELHQVRIQVAAGAAHPPASVVPAVEPAPGLRVSPAGHRLPGPLETMRFDVGEETAAAGLLHRAWLDRPGHGKSVQAVAYPVASTGVHSGASWGLGVGFVDATREGIGTGAVNVRAQHNEYVGNLVALDVLSCPAAYHNYWLSAFVAEDDTTRGVSYHLENLTRGDGAWGYEATLNAFEDGRFRFYGVGSGADEEAETAYAHEQWGGTLDLYWNAATHWRLGGGVRYADVDVGRAADDLLAETTSIFDGFPGGPGVDGGSVVAPRLTVIFDRRNQEFTPSRGTLARLTVERVELDEAGSQELADSWTRWELSARHYWSTPGQRYTLLFSGRVEEASEGEIPFWEMPALGGESSLRAYGEGRFRDQGAFVGTVELRVHALHMVAMGMPIDVEVAPFVDLGRVYDGDLFGEDFFDDGFNVDPGISLRILNRPNVGLVANWAYGRDGGQITGGVSLPL